MGMTYIFMHFECSYINCNVDLSIIGSAISSILLFIAFFTAFKMRLMRVELDHDLDKVLIST